MITTVPMELVSFLVIKDKTQEVAGRLVALGVFHPVDIRGIEDKLESLSSFQIDKEAADYDLLQSKVHEITRKLRVDLRGEYESDIQSFSYQSAQAFLDARDKEIAPVLEQVAQLQEQIATDEMILAQVREYLPFPVRSHSLYSFLFVSTGKIEEKNIMVVEKSLLDIPHVIYPFRKDASRVYAIFIGLRRDRALLDKVLRDVAWEEIDYPKDADSISKEAQEKISVKIKDNKARIGEFNFRIKALAGQNKAELVRINSAIRVHKSLLEAKRYSCTTDKTALFTGWVPREKKDELISQIKSISGISYVESRKAELVDIPREEIPVQFKHAPFLRPFELLIGAYGIPRYGSIDPTVFVAISFLIMFGAMFGDIGHGMVLVLLGFILGSKARKKIFQQVQMLLFYCGGSSVVFGFLYGSFFGYEFDSLWLKPIENIMEVFKISIFLGIAMISLGIIVNIINSLRDRNYIKLFFDKSGLIGGLIYWAAIGLVVKLFLSPGPIPFYYSFLILSGILVIFLYPIVDCVIKKKYAHLMESIMESTVGVMEIFMGYLANTVSFIRVAAFALAHAGLFIAIFNLSNIVHTNNRIGDIDSWLVIIFGNILVIALEGMVVTIQSIRLNYYEFFSKFFIGGKKVYKPLTV
jgi:V/A-type H+/Na+-transporting ATPase subunit I